MACRIPVSILGSMICIRVSRMLNGTFGGPTSRLFMASNIVDWGSRIRQSEGNAEGR